MASHKKQHFVPRSYLKAWCDPNTPAAQEPYVWRFNKDGSDPRRKAPENIFHETDLYTIKLPDGSRNLSLEHGLSTLEDKFVSILNAKLEKERPLDETDRVFLCAFLAAMQSRTPAQRDHLSQQWGEVLEMADDIKESATTATEEQRRGMAIVSAPHDPERGLSYDQVKALAERPLQNAMPTMIGVLTPLLMRVDMAVLNSDSAESAFITSDHPCVWYDPEAHKRPPFYQAPGLGYPSIEITLPVSPRQMILFNRRGYSGYLPVPEGVVDEMNRRTRFHCSEHFVTNSETTKLIWFDLGVEPEDSWEKRHAENRPRKAPPSSS